ncbi:MAG: hypothetical protein ACO3VS_14485, partial [Limisphaerales bacterium]
MKLSQSKLLHRHDISLAWIFALMCYAGHLGFQAILPSSGWLRSYWSDFWMMPCALPPVLWLHGRLGIRPRGMRPTPSEIKGHLVLWSFLAEGVARLILDRSPRDPWDLLAYPLRAVLL